MVYPSVTNSVTSNINMHKHTHSVQVLSPLLLKSQQGICTTDISMLTLLNQNGHIYQRPVKYGSSHRLH